MSLEELIKERIDALEYDRIGEVNKTKRESINIKLRELRYMLRKNKEEAKKKFKIV